MKKFAVALVCLYPILLYAAPYKRKRTLEEVRQFFNNSATELLSSSTESKDSDDDEVLDKVRLGRFFRIGTVEFIGKIEHGKLTQTQATQALDTRVTVSLDGRRAKGLQTSTKYKITFLYPESSS